jgi:protein-S-isoprenylcysteine O-methyltransferase Ste14
MFDKSHLFLFASLVLWCILHSAMISNRFITTAKRLLREQFRFYRLFYNAIAVLTLVPIYIQWRSINAISFFEWTGSFRVIQASLILVALFFLLAGARHYDGLQFLGLRQILSKNHAIGLTASGKFHSTGILNVTRHPWYVAAFLVLWARNINSVSLMINIVFSIYLLVGTLLEERKLTSEFGQPYIDYQKRVSMFFPWKWIIALFKLEK